MTVATEDSIEATVLWIEREDVTVAGTLTVEDESTVVTDDAVVAFYTINVVVATTADYKAAAKVADNDVVAASLRIHRVHHRQFVKAVALKENHVTGQDAVTRT